MKPSRQQQSVALRLDEIIAPGRNIRTQNKIDETLAFGRNIRYLTEQEHWRRGGTFVVTMLLIMGLYVALVCLARVTGLTCDSSLSGSGEGQCTLIANCPELLERFHALEIPLFLEQYGCGTDSGSVLVCCPRVTAVIHPPSESGSAEFPPSCGAEKINKGANWPFHVGLGRTTTNSHTAYCNGVLITPEWVLTEAFCFTEYIIEVALFGLGTADPNQVVTIPVKYNRWHPNFDAFADKNNIGLAKLETSMQLTDNIQIACSPSGPTLPSPSGQLFALFAATVDDGTGRQVLEAFSEPKGGVDFESCRSKPDLPIPSVDESHRCTDAVRFCAYTRPILVQQNQQGSYTLVGLGGLQAEKCSLGTATFTDVSKHLKYINSVLKTQDTQTELVDVLYQLSNALAKMPNSTICGRRVVEGGSEWPFLVSLGDYDSDVGGPNGEFTSQCTGVVLTPEWILSDAKCVTSNSVRLAGVGIKGGFSTTSYRAVVNIVLPPGHDPPVDNNTVALIKIRLPPTGGEFNEHVQPVCRQQPVPYDNKPVLHALSSGYSSTPEGGVRLSSNMKIVARSPISTCQASRYVPFAVSDESYICSVNIYICGNFISNPPVLLEQEEHTGRFTVVGVGGDNENHCYGDRMAFVRVKPHLTWIKGVLFPLGDPEDQILAEIQTLG